VRVGESGIGLDLAVVRSWALLFRSIRSGFELRKKPRLLGRRMYNRKCPFVEQWEARDLICVKRTGRQSFCSFILRGKCFLCQLHQELSTRDPATCSNWAACASSSIDENPSGFITNCLLAIQQLAETRNVSRWKRVLLPSNSAKKGMGCEKN